MVCGGALRINLGEKSVNTDTLCYWTQARVTFEDTRCRARDSSYITVSRDLSLRKEREER